MSEINFPGSAVDGSTFFHGDNVCVYHAEDNTWECRSVVSETPQPPINTIYMTTPKIYTLGDKRTEWKTALGTQHTALTDLVTPVATQEEVNDVIINLLAYVHSGSIIGVDYATEEWVGINYAPLVHTHTDYAATVHNHDGAYAPLNHTHGDDGGTVDHPTRAEFDALVAVVTGNFNTLLAAITS